MEFKYTGMIKCPRCGTENPVGSTKCASCERMLVSSGPVKLLTDYRIALAGWAIALSTIGVVLFYALGPAARDRGFVGAWLYATRFPFDVLCDSLGQTRWKAYWWIGSIGVWMVLGALVGSVLNLMRKK